MKIDIQGNPGTGNTFMEIHIEHVENFHTAVPDNGNGSPINKDTRARHPRQPVQQRPTEDIADLRAEILEYVNRLRTFLADQWKGSYRQTWESILDIEIVSMSVYIPGKQRATNFNRSLVANIIHYLHGRGAYGDNYNAARFAEFLEGDKDHSVRGALGRDPSDEIVSRLDRHFE